MITPQLGQAHHVYRIKKLFAGALLPLPTSLCLTKPEVTENYRLAPVYPRVINNIYYILKQFGLPVRHIIAIYIYIYSAT
jgi:hypothetical protein